MRKGILDVLGRKFAYDPGILQCFYSTLDIRFGKDSDIYKKFKASKKLKLASLEDEEFMTELKRLNLMALKSRVNMFKEKVFPETVITKYLEALFNELEHDSSINIPTAELEVKEKEMLDHLLNVVHYNEDLTELQGLNNMNLRMVLQSWIIYPNIVKEPEEVKELLACLELSNLF